MNAPRHWQQWDQQPFRACAVCSFGLDSAGAPCGGGKAEAIECICPAVTGRANGSRTVPVRLTRANTGACGPEAHHMEFRGLCARV